MNVRALSVNAAGIFFTNRFHVVMMPVFLTCFWNQALNLDLPLAYYVMITLTTAGGYIYNIYTDGAEDGVNYRRRYRLFLPGDRSTLLVIYACFFGGFLLSFTSGLMFVLYGGLVHFLGSLYSRPLPFKRNGRPLRIKEVPFLKNLYAGLFWSVALILTPYIYLGATPDAVAAIAIVISFCMNYFVELAWDIRDIPGDTRAGFRTVPIVIGEAAAYRLLTVVHVVTCALCAYGAWIGLLPEGCYVVAAMHLPFGFAYIAWYRKLADKDWASHLYIMYAGVLLSAGMIWNLIYPSQGV